MKEILIATHNEHKKEEIQNILGNGFLVKSLSDYNITEEIEENGKTFNENALIKAQYCFDKTGVPSIGDDSGLVVEALNGRPGIFSARYAGDHDFQSNIQKVLHELEGIENRKAYFVTVMCLVDNDGIQYFEGRINGTITKENKGHKGFGYDPIFIPENCEKTFAEMLPEEKNKISHRRRAIDKLLKILV
ncbi:RdgB/HAM1 family non-canonical purine NTP pyrophosphatase [Riemerella columbipharyngis]|uniref:dITP/XTP pyrophosphatase n=1 Tax=Riemerella columbipharyngis TaxID=1071918 RepID=A0A1G6YSB4_9FLAO|nr:RdgB/HAM1 family non-canonical purine NTP pyrophosphatase [Riemerella columbipharyngis]SDD93394.1 XTP/dITP diphosphohydrolase [Riemerella columbipharyngis]